VPGLDYCLATPAFCASTTAEEFSVGSAEALLQLVQRLPEADQCLFLHRLAGSTTLSRAAADGHNAFMMPTPLPLVAFLVLAICTVAHMARVVRDEKRRYQEHNAFQQGSFGQYLRYRFGYWYAWTPGSAGIVLLLLSLGLLLFAGFLMWLLDERPMSESMWSAWIWIAAPDGGASAETRSGRLIGLITSVGGMLIFALLMSVISSFFEEGMQGLREGRLPVIEGNHIVILSHATNQLAVLLEEICFAEESEGGVLIAVLSPTPKVDVEEFLKDRNVRDWMRNSTIVVRSGDMRKQQDLQKVAVQAAKKVVVMSKPGVSREEADVVTLTALMTLRSSSWPSNGTCTVQCQLVRNQGLFVRLAKEGSKVLTTVDFVGDLLVQCSQQCGLAEVVRAVFSFEGDEFYTKCIQGVEGRSFFDVLFALPGAIAIGIIGLDGRVELVPPMQRMLKHGEELVVLAADDSEIPDRATEGNFQRQFQQHWRSSQVGSVIQDEPPSPQQTIIVVGWNEMLGAMIVELDRALGPDSTLIIHSPVSVADRESFIEMAQKRRHHECKNLTFQHTLGSLGARFMLEELAFETASAIVVLADAQILMYEDSSAADAQTLAVCVQIQDILKIRGSRTMIMPQLLDSDSEELALYAGIGDYFLTDQLAARITACVTEVPQLRSVIDCIVKDRSCSFCIRKLSDYPLAGSETTGKVEIMEELAPPKFGRHCCHVLGTEDTEDQTASGIPAWSLDLNSGITFDEVTALAASAGEVALGWSSLDPSASKAWEMNPKDRMDRRTWSQDMQLVVLHKHVTTCAATSVANHGSSSSSNGEQCS